MMNSESYKYLFGPVPSRRLGQSLGVDIVPMKTCTQNCLYCQLGKDAPGVYDLNVKLPGEEVRSFPGLTSSGGLKGLEWLGFVSLAREKTTFYLDNIKLSLHDNAVAH